MMGDVNMCCGGVGLHKFGCPTGTSLWREQRIAALEAENKHLLTRITQLREYRDQMLELTQRAEQAEAALAERDEALTIAWRLCLQEAWGDLREHLDCTVSVGPVARVEEEIEFSSEDRIVAWEAAVVQRDMKNAAARAKDGGET